MQKIITTLICTFVALITALTMTATPSFAQAESETSTAIVVQSVTDEKEPLYEAGTTTEESADEELAGRRKGRPGKGLLQ